MALHPVDPEEGKPDPTDTQERIERLSPARGITVGIVIAVLFWAAVAFLVLRLRR